VKQDWRLQLSFDTTLKIGFQELRFTSDGELLSRELDESYYTCARGYRVESLPSSWIECVGLILTRSRANAGPVRPITR